MKEVKKFYKYHYEKYKDDAKGTGWFNPEEIPIRFELMKKIADLSNTSILDVGCGFGAFYKYLKENVKEFFYLGVDIMPEMVEVAMQKHPEAKFKVKNILDEPIDNFDYAFCIGTFNITDEEITEHVRKMITKIASIVKKGFGLNFLSDKKYLCAGPYHFEDPKELKEFIEGLGFKVEIIEDKRVIGESFIYAIKA